MGSNFNLVELWANKPCSKAVCVAMVHADALPVRNNGLALRLSGNWKDRASFTFVKEGADALLQYTLLEIIPKVVFV